MIDTISIKNFYRTQPSIETLEKNNWIFKRYENPVWIYNPKKGSCFPRLTLIKTPDGIFHLKAEVSIPKMLFGNNIRLPNEDEIWHGLRQIAEYAELKSGLPFNLETAVICRVDYTKDYPVGNHAVIPIIACLAKSSIKRHDRMFFNDSTLYFNSKGKTKGIRIYSKYHETLEHFPKHLDLHDLAGGILRIEHSFSDTDGVNQLVKKLGFKNKKAKGLLTKETAEFVLKECEKNFDWNNCDLDFWHERFVLLNKHHKLQKVFTLIGFLILVKQFGEKFYKNKSLGLKKSSYYRYTADCQKANVWV